MVRLIKLLCLFLLLSWGALAQSVKVDIPKEVEQGKPFTIQYHFGNADGDVKVLQEPQADHLRKVYGPAIAQTASVQVINGKVKSDKRLSITFTFLPSEIGVVKVSPARFEINGSVLEATGQSLKIVEALRTPTQGGSQAKPSFGIKTNTSKSVIYEQEPVLVTHRLWGSVPYRITRFKPLGNDDFVHQDLLESNEIAITEEIEGGRRFLVSTIGHDILYPQKTGKLKVSQLDLSVSYTAPNPIDAFFAETREQDLRSKPLEVEVLPLPLEGKPQDFSEAVGQFVIRYELPNNRVWKTNEAISFNLIIEGIGNLKVCKTPKLELPESLEVYDPVEQTEHSYRDGKVRAVRKVEYSLIPREVGSLTLPSVAFTYFDPQAKAYRLAKTDPVSIKIVEGRALASSTVKHTVTQGTSQTPYGYLTYIKPSTHGMGKYLYVGLHLLLLVVAYVAYVLLRRHQSFRADTIGYNESRAGKVARTRLKQANKLLADRNYTLLYEELLRVLWGYLGDKLKLPQSALNKDVILEHLQDRGAKPELLAELKGLLERIEFTRFAPSAGDEQPKQLCETTAQCIAHLEEQL